MRYRWVGGFELGVISCLPKHIQLLCDDQVSGKVRNLVFRVNLLYRRIRLLIGQFLRPAFDEKPQYKWKRVLVGLWAY